MELQNVCFSYGSNEVLNEISLTFDEPELVCIMGPNGVGKTTLMRCMSRLIRPTSGKISLNGIDIKEMSRMEVARHVGFVPRSAENGFPVSVFDAVMVARTPYLGSGVSTKKDMEITAEALRRMDVDRFAMRQLDELSAGQHQMVMIARGLAQETEILLLDEPTANLDLKHQMRVMRALKEITEERQMTMVVICHDINLPSRYADRMIMMLDGKINCIGCPEEIITEDNIRTVYGVDSKIMDHNGSPFIVPLESDKDDIEHRL